MSLLLVFHSGNYADPVQDGQSVNATGNVQIGVLQSIIQSYLYQQYADDSDLQAFVAAYNTLAQSYLDWFNQTPLAVYTSPNVYGPLLDWIGNGIYGVARPVFSSLVTRYVAGLNAFPINTVAVNGKQYFQSGNATLATDDYYKRVLTWTTYIGNGRHFNFSLLRLKVARFLYGVNGTDIELDLAQMVNVTSTGPASYTITIPPGVSSTFFQQAFEQGILALPFQLSGTVVIS